jgi:hypothetical protein
LFIPPGIRDELQPLDGIFFGAMKVNCHQMCRVQLAEEGVISKQVAASFLIGVWEGVSMAVLDEAWAISEGFDPGEDGRYQSKTYFIQIFRVLAVLRIG